MYGYLYIPMNRTSLSNRMNATGLLMPRSRSAPASGIGIREVEEYP